MTRDEFIDYWMRNTGLPAECRTADGVQFPADARFPGYASVWVALPCACANEDCQGWAMVPEDTAEHHMRFYAPKPQPGQRKDDDEVT